MSGSLRVVQGLVQGLDQVFSERAHVKVVTPWGIDGNSEGPWAETERGCVALDGSGDRLQLPLPLSCAIVEHIFLRRDDCASNHGTPGGSFRRDRGVA